MKKHGKGDFIDFNSDERAKMRSIFKQLDEDNSGVLTLDELYEPLLALGLVENKKQVVEMMKKVDTNNSGVIEFEEFIKILNQKNHENNILVKFFKDLAKETVFTEYKDLPFNLVFSNRRRELMMQSYLGKNSNAREQGKRIMNAFVSEVNEKEENNTKMLKMKNKNEDDLKKLLKRKNGLRILKEKNTSQGTFITNVSRPQTASKKPMTRKRKKDI